MHVPHPHDSEFFGVSNLRSLRKRPKLSPGDLAVGWPGVAWEKFGLSHERRDKIAKFNRRGSLFGGDRDTNPPNLDDPAQERFQQTIDEANKRAAENREKILLVPTPEQKAKWPDMTDESFKFPSPQRSVTRGTGEAKCREKRPIASAVTENMAGSPVSRVIGP